jgi:hypothetical protein
LVADVGFRRDHRSSGSNGKAVGAVVPYCQRSREDGEMPTRQTSTASQIEDAEIRATEAEAAAAAARQAAEAAGKRAASLEEELARVRASHRMALMTVAVVAMLAILMLGIVAFNAVG